LVPHTAVPNIFEIFKLAPETVVPPELNLNPVGLVLVRELVPFARTSFVPVYPVAVVRAVSSGHVLDGVSMP
jgi:hypothetical protein